MATEIKFAWKSFFRNEHIKAQDAGEELLRIEAKYDGLRPENIVNESRDNDAVLHNYFEWDDSIAGDKYRTQQAEALTRAIIVRQVDDKVIDNPVRGFVPVKMVPVEVLNDEIDASMQPGRYRNVVSIMSDADMRQQVIDRALMELEQFKRKYADLLEFVGLFKEIDKLLKKAS